MVVTIPSRPAIAPAAPRYLRSVVPVHFPVADVVPETKRHLRQRTTLWQILELAFRKEAAIGCDQFVYWDPTDPRQCLAPDAFVRLGLPDESFDSWKVWERGAPDVAVEILSSSDARDGSIEAKVERYRRLGVRELVCFDAERDPPSLRVWNSVDGDLVERALDGHVAPSLCLPVSWVVVPDDESVALLRVSRGPEGKDLLPTPAELEQEKRIQAERRVAELEAELRRRGT
jgi:hypothetical protein